MREGYNGLLQNLDTKVYSLIPKSSSLLTAACRNTSSRERNESARSRIGTLRGTLTGAGQDLIK